MRTVLQLDAVNPATANPTKPVAFRGDASVAPSLQVNVDFERAVDKVGLVALACWP
jgi:hypothetical protein